VTSALARSILGIGEAASPDEIRAAWRAAVKAHHPDLHPDNPHAEQEFQQVQRAYQLLVRAGQAVVHADSRENHAWGPQGPFTPAQLSALDLLGLRPGATFADIELQYQRRKNSQANDDILYTAYALLMGEHAAARTWPAPSSSSPTRTRSGPRYGPRAFVALLGWAALVTCALLCYSHVTGGNFAAAQECGTTSDTNCFTLVATAVVASRDGGQLPLAGILQTKAHVREVDLASGMTVTTTTETDCLLANEGDAVILKSWAGRQTDLVGDFFHIHWDCSLRDRPSLSFPDSPFGALVAGVIALAFFIGAGRGTRVRLG
jgi:hypothetical protein